jgi:hypothetical protein
MSPFRRRAWWRAARGWAVALLLIAAFPLVWADSARAQSFTVATVAALIAAINSANANGQANTITLAPGATYALAAANNGATGDETGLPRITGNLTLTGSGATIARSSAADTPHFRIFAVSNGGVLTLDGLTIRNGSISGVAGVTHASGTGFPGGAGGPAAGGGIVVAGGGALSVTNCTFIGNSATGGAGGDGSSGANHGSSAGGSGGTGGNGGGAGGGAISNGGTLIVRGAAFVGNTAAGGAGGNGGNGGQYTVIVISTGATTQSTINAAGTAGSTTITATGGAGGPGAVVQGNL